MHLLLGAVAGVVVILIAALGPRSPAKRYALLYITATAVTLMFSYMLLMAQSYGLVLLVLFGGLLISAELWRRMFSSR